MERITKRYDDRVGFAENGTPAENMCKFPIVLSKLAEYEDIGATPDELKTAVSLYLEMSQKMRRIVKDMKYYLDANEEDGVVYIPKFVIEEIAYGR